MQPANHGSKNRIKKSSNIVWLTAFLLAVLVAATIAIVGSCLYGYAHQSDCQISLYSGWITPTTGTLGNNAANQRRESRTPVIDSKAMQYSGAEAQEQAAQSTFEVDDATQVWKTETAIELFQTEYKNANGEVTVKSSDGSKVIAPGTEGSYTFSLKNTSESAADYKIWVEAKLNSNITGVPIETRMSSDDGWLLGGKNSWEQADALDGVATAETIDAGRTVDYTIYWQWPFEQGNDAADTNMGEASVDQEMSYTVTIYTLTATATGDGSQENQNPLQNILKNVKTGDNTTVILWIVILIAAAGVLFCLIIMKNRKNGEENEQNEPEQRI